MSKWFDVMVCIATLRTAEGTRYRLGKELRDLSGGKWTFSIDICSDTDDGTVVIGVWSSSGSPDRSMTLKVDQEQIVSWSSGKYKGREVQEVVSIVEEWLASESKGVLE